jgi:hypothetical protein
MMVFILSAENARGETMCDKNSAFAAHEASHSGEDFTP